MNLIESIMTRNPCYRSGRKITVKGLMLHSVGCSQPNARVFINNWNKETFNTACVHGFIDANTGDVYQTLPWNHRGWHGGGSSNNTHIGVEMCEPACIKYVGGASFTCSDYSLARTMVEKTYRSAVELFAFLCKEYGLDPLGDGVIVSHKEGCARGIASNHGDPEHLWNGLGMNYTMDGFRQDVAIEMGAKVAFTETPVNLIGTVTADILNIRSVPNSASTHNIIGKHAYGDVVYISAETDNGWYRVDYPNIGTGYIYSEYVSVSEPVIEDNTDVPVDSGVDNVPDEWAQAAINSAKEMGILFGDETGDLKLHKECTRQEVIIFLHRLYKNINT